MNDLSKSGNCWPPGKQEKQFHGELEFNQTEEGTLLLTDSFDNLWDFPLYNQDFLLLDDLTQVSITSKAGSTLYFIP